MRISFSRRRGPPLSPGKLMIVGPLIGLLLIGLAALAAAMGTENERYARDGLLFDAEVIGASKRDDGTSFITVRVSNSRLRPHTNEVPVDAETFKKFQPASEFYPMPTKVHHVPDHPKMWQHVNELDGGDKNRTPIVVSFSAIGIGMMLLGVLAFTKWRRGETVMQKPVDDAVSPEVIAALQRFGIPTAHFPQQQAMQAAPWDMPPSPPPKPGEHVLYDGDNPPNKPEAG